MGDWLSHFTVAVPDAPGVVQALRQEGRGALVVEELSAVIPVYSQGGSKQGTWADVCVGCVRVCAVVEELAAVISVYLQGGCKQGTRAGVCVYVLWEGWG